MNAKTTIRKILFITVWLCIGGGMLTLLLAAITNKKNGECSEYVITLKGPENNFFINEKDVEELLMNANVGLIRGQAVASFNLNELERMLEKNTWISKAELYFDNKDVLHVTVTEKEPVARIFTTEGNSFYIDQAGKKMPLSEKLSARVPVFTGFPEKKALSAKDSALLTEVRLTAQYIISNPFWMSQVAQIDITAERKFEMVPVVGNHLVKLGDGENIPAKFNRLMIFYRLVLSKTGFDKYKLIDVQYKGQVVASEYAGDPKVDSVQLRKNVEKLLRQSAEVANDTVVKKLPPVSEPATDAILTGDVKSPAKEAVNPEQQTDPNPRLDITTPAVRQPADGGQAVKTPVKKEIEPAAAAKKASVKKEEIKRPKAVMPKKPEDDENGGYN
ncbi:MAG: cell division protein FtsQ/DivIB [Bacteroidota bacterium]